MRAELETLERDLEGLARGDFLCRPAPIALSAIDLLTPPERISTTDCAARYRLIPDKVGTGATLWSPTLTPYINKIQDLLDDPEVKLVVVPKAGRTGGTVAGENYLFKLMKFGPLPDVLWYLPSDSERDSYVDRHVSKIFELHPDIAAKLGLGRSDNKLARKKVADRLLEWLQLNSRTVTGRDAGFIAGDEIDAANRKLMPSFVDQVKIRGTTAGTRFKGYLCSHMDAGWTVGIAAAWKESNRGIWYWPCSNCNGYSSPCPTAPKGMHMRLSYERPAGVSDDELLDIVENTAGMLCPHCAKLMADVHKAAMNEGGDYVFEGQLIGRDGKILGEPRSKAISGAWIHGSMSPWVGFGDMARRYVAALLVFERTRKSDRLREVTAKVIGEVYEGGGKGAGSLDPTKLRERAEAQDEDEVFNAGTFPRGALFATAAVDVGGRKFDVQIEGWDIESRNWKIERFTLTQRRLPDGRMVDLRPPERQEDWIVLRDEVLRRLVPLQDNPGHAMPIAGMAIDTGDGHVTWKAREFCRRMLREGESGAKGYRVRLIKGGTSKNAPEVGAAREINKDDENKPIVPSVREFTLNVDKLKALVIERLVLDEDGPGYVRFADNLPHSLYDELCGEVFIDGKFERRGANESLDLSGYNEAVRQMLQPERADIKWDVKKPVWARPVPMTGTGEALPAEPKKTTLSAIERMAALNKRRS
ncbi:MAG: hypothetical protein QOH47_2403 [Sphingomonadales bacterium]|jgi:phage terminase large subunit GpA-like protein|nr:hypothetical protein [Sphingomonadales bacterium]